MATIGRPLKIFRHVVEVVGLDVPSCANGRFGQIIQTQTLGSALSRIPLIPAAEPA